MNRLQEIAANRRQAIAPDIAARPLDGLRAAAADLPPARGFHRALRETPRAVISEIKRASPSAGDIRPDAGAAEMAALYAGAGAACLSVLTEPDYFGGSIEDLVAAREAVPLPAIRKDFVIDPWQLADSRVAGADAVLLIVALLGEETASYLRQATELGVDALIEVHDEAELEVALASGGTLIGVNNRDLRDLSINLATFERLAPMATGDVTLVAESGVQTAEDARRMFEAGATALLVGSSLMAADDPAAALRALRDYDGKLADVAGDGVGQDLRHHAA